MLAVIPGWSLGPDPESRDSGFASSMRPGMTTKRSSIQQLHIFRRLRRRFDRDRLECAAIGLGAALRRALGNDDEIAGFHPLVAKPNRAGAVKDVLHLVGVGMQMLWRIAVLDRDGDAI